MVAVFIIIILAITPVGAKNHGVHGHTFKIIEPDLLKHILNRLHSLEAEGQIAAHQERLKKRAVQAIRRPKAVKGFSRATKKSITYYDPSMTVPYDLKDQTGQVFHQAGTRVNPLTHRPLTKKLVFIDGDDPHQVSWAIATFTEVDSKIILISGSPFDLMETYDRPIYFDQAGRITAKLGITKVPTIVSQEGVKLKREEVVL